MPDGLLERKHEVDVLYGGVECGVGEDLEEKGGPVGLELARQLHFEDLRGGARIGVAFHRAEADDLVKRQRPTSDDGIHLGPRLTTVLQEGLGGLRDTHLLERRSGHPRIRAVTGSHDTPARGSSDPLEDRGVDGGERDVSNRETEEVLGDAAEHRIRLVLRKDLEEGVGIRERLTFWDTELLGQEFLEAGARGASTGRKNLADTHLGLHRAGNIL